MATQWCWKLYTLIHSVDLLQHSMVCLSLWFAGETSLRSGVCVRFFFFFKFNRRRCPRLWIQFNSNKKKIAQHERFNKLEKSQFRSIEFKSTSERQHFGISIVNLNRMLSRTYKTNRKKTQNTTTTKMRNENWIWAEIIWKTIDRLNEVNNVDVDTKKNECKSIIIYFMVECGVGQHVVNIRVLSPSIVCPLQVSCLSS